MKLTRDTRLENQTGDPAVQKALDDLRGDLSRCLSASAPAHGLVTVAFDPALATPESYAVEVLDQEIRIRASDRLGAIYGIYRVSREFLGVDPFWFWKNQEPAQRESVEIPSQSLESAAPTFRLRGWFINDEDLLSEWQNGGGRRDIRYPYYAQVVHPDVMERVCETCLRAGCNLIIPASFLDVMNPAEARLVEIAVARGLLVTQHHVEPLGVSHFGFENYWRDRGESVEFSYSREPERVVKVWRAYAERWHELAGEQVVWQLGLRGKGDRAVWVHDAGISEQTAGEFISRAFREQWEIVRAVDPRQQPPATTTLWNEMSQLMAAGTLQIPTGVSVIFTNDGWTQTMREDFYQTPREAGRRYGVYTHAGYWERGPHLAQGTDPAKMKRLVDEVVARGDTDYAILNVANIRETALGAAAFCELVQDHAGFSPDRFLAAWAGEEASVLYREFVNALPHFEGDRIILQDGYLFTLVRGLITSHEIAQPPKLYLVDGGHVADAAALRKELTDSAARFETLLGKLDSAAYPQETRRFHDFSLRIQGRMIRRMLRTVLHLLDRNPDAAAEEIRALLDERREAEYGRWQHWYRGDRKENWPHQLQRLEALAPHQA